LLVNFLPPHRNNGSVSRHRAKGNDYHDQDGKFGEKGFWGIRVRDGE